MRSPSEISQLLDELDTRPADDLREMTESAPNGETSIGASVERCPMLTPMLASNVRAIVRLTLAAHWMRDGRAMCPAAIVSWHLNRIAIARASTGMPCSLPRLQ